jgi:hypothetical protein
MGQRHKYADLIHAWAEGAEIEHNAIDNPDDSGWQPASNPAWDSELLKFRAKPNWWENIPEHGVLVKDVFDNIVRITATNNPRRWIPLTNKEIEAFKRRETIKK